MLEEAMTPHEKAVKAAWKASIGLTGYDLRVAIQAYLTTLLDSPEMVCVIIGAIPDNIYCYEEAAKAVIAAIKKEVGCERISR